MSLQYLDVKTPQTGVVLDSLWYVEIANIRIRTHIQGPERRHSAERPTLKQRESLTATFQIKLFVSRSCNVQ
jgi:hypothetical protein